jgi:protein-tyrosine phosphatase
MRDAHSHILFGVDDGSRSFEESQEMFHAARAVGITKIVCTPHFHSSDFNRKRIEENFEVFKNFAEPYGVETRLGFEVHWRALVEVGIEAAPEFRVSGSNLLLLEFSCGLLPSNWRRLIFELQALGLRIMIAHPERYAPIQKDVSIAEEMRRMGCLLQLSADFVSGGFFSVPRKTAIALIEQGLIDYVASDAHCVADYQDYPKALEIWRKKRPS